MEAITFTDFGPATNLKPTNVPAPEPKDEEVVVDVKAIGVNPVETVIRSGMAFTQAFEALPYKVLGWDIAGKVVQQGPKAEHWEIGDPVFGMVHFPNPALGYAARVCAPEMQLTRIPDTVTYTDAAAACLAALTAYQGLFHHGGLEQGQQIAILNAGGGVGHFAVQLAKQVGATVYATASDQKNRFLETLGADHPVDYRTQDLNDVAQGLDLVLDGAGGEATQQGLKALKKGGRLVSLMPNATDLPDKAAREGKTGQIMMVEPSGKDMEAIAASLAKGDLRPHIEANYLFHEMYKAHQHLEAGHTAGKVVATRP